MDETHPVCVFLYYAASASVLMISMNLYFVVPALIGSFVSFLILTKKRALRAHLLNILVFLLTALINPLISHKGSTVLFMMNDSPVTLESLIYGASAGALACAMLYFFRAASGILTDDKLMSVFSALSPKLALILSVALRYIPLFARQRAKISESQRSLGLYRENSAIDRIRGGSRIFGVLMTWGLEKGIITADSMSARGYGTGRRSVFRLYRFDMRDLIFLILTAALTAVSIIGVTSVKYSYYPVFSTGKRTALLIVSSLSYLALSLLPACLEIKERIKWKYLISKI